MAARIDTDWRKAELKMSGSRFRSFLLLMMLLAIAPLAAEEEEMIPLQAWVHDPLIDAVDISPDGKRLAALTLNPKGVPDVTLWHADDLTKPPLRWAPEDSKAIGAFWLSNDYLFVIGRQKFDYRYGGKPTRWMRNKFYAVSTNKPLPTGVSIFSGSDGFVGGGLVNLMRTEPEKVLVYVITRELVTDLYELELSSWKTRRVYRGLPTKSAFTNFRGEVYGRIELEAGGTEGTHLRYSYKHPETGQWEEHHNVYAKKREGMSPAAQDPDGRTLYMLDNRGREKKVVRKYDLITREIGEPVFGGDDIETLSIIQSQHPATYGAIIGFRYADDRLRREIIHPVWKQLYSRIEDALPEDQVHRIASASDDLNLIVIESTGDREPGTWHLLKNRQELIFLGRTHPGLDPEKLNQMTYVEYQARDGLTIPAYLTLPQRGKAPWPAVVLPHGGPWVRDYWGWNLWVQFLANRGYAVLQPNYRGSDGWGQKLWRAGDREWGLKMQDDKDDGAAWLVEQGITEANRIAIFGYSYGGYAAMAAAVRPDSPYQCAIAGAGLAELRSFDKVTYENPFMREYQNPTIAGLSPLDHVEDANIPIYIFHGDRDQRVPVIQSRKYYRALQKAGADVRYKEVPDLWHSYPWFPTHHLAILEILEDYLGNDCGPGGL